MRTIFSCFDFKSSDLECEERNYAEVHRALAKQLPDLRQYLTGRLRAPTGRTPILSFDSDADAEATRRKSPVVKSLVADTREHLQNLRWLEMDSEIIAPFESKQSEREYVQMAAEFDLRVEQAGFSDAASAEQHYLGEHTRSARKLPNLRHYMVGRLVETAGWHPDRSRFALFAFDNAEALRAAYRLAVGTELLKDEEATIANARVFSSEAMVQI